MGDNIAGSRKTGTCWTWRAGAPRPALASGKRGRRMTCERFMLGVAVATTRVEAPMAFHKVSVQGKTCLYYFEIREGSDHACM